METAIALLVVLIPLTYQAWQYLDQRKRELKDKRFETYHNLIRSLVGPTDEKAIMMYLDRQIAIVFELRNFLEYAEVSERILKGLKDAWFENANNARLLTEIDLTLKYLSNKNKSKKP